MTTAGDFKRNVNASFVNSALRSIKDELTKNDVNLVVSEERRHIIITNCPYLLYEKIVILLQDVFELEYIP